MNTSNEPNGLSVRTLLTVAGLIVLFFLAGHLWDTYASSASVVKTNVPVTEKAPAGVRFAKIQEIQVGERAIGKNPEIDDEDRRSFFPDPDPATWRKLTLEMLKPDGKRLDITLLRPLTWLEESSAEPGATIYLDLAELGAQGNAKVITVEPCPPIKPGKGNVVTGTFHHEAANTIDLYVDGVEKPIGTTDNHPFWSVTKQEFVEAGKLLPGEELQLHSGQTAKVVQLLPRPGPERVHNLEILNEHVYFVAEFGILTHNFCAKNNWFNDTGKIRRYDGHKPAYASLSEHPNEGAGYGNPNKTPIPHDAEAVFAKAVPNDPDNPTAWFGQNATGQVYRFSGTANEVHFNGIAGVGDGTRNINPYVFMRLHIERKHWNEFW